MPTLIVFGSSSPEQSTRQADTVRVEQDAESVVEGLSANGSGFAAFDLPGDRGKVWVNSQLVRMVRETGGGKA